MNVYDLIIFPTLWLEGLFVGNKSGRREHLDSENRRDDAYVEEAIGPMDDSGEYKEPQE